MDPDIRYARSEGASIAYQIVGDGERDLVFVPDFSSNLVYGWETPYWRPFYERLAASFRLILFDKRGTGVSDRHGQFATLETRMEDLRAVLDAAGASKPVILASHDGCDMAMLFAATYPERTEALALFHPQARPEEQREWEEEFMQRVRFEWGTQEFCDQLLEVVCPRSSSVARKHACGSRTTAGGASPDRVRAEPGIRARPTCGRCCRRSKRRRRPLPRLGEVDQHREVDRADPGRAERCSCPGRTTGIFLSPEIVDEIEQFVAERPVAAVPDCVLATVLFTDIAGSTERAAELGDRGWREPSSGTMPSCGASSPGSAARSGHGRRRLLRHLRRPGARDPLRPIRDGTGPRARARVACGPPHGRVRAPRREGRRHRRLDRRSCCSARRPGEVSSRQTVKDLVAGSGIDFDDRGEHELKGVPGAWKLYAVT